VDAPVFKPGGATSMSVGGTPFNPAMKAFNPTANAFNPGSGSFIPQPSAMGAQAPSFTPNNSAPSFSPATSFNAMPQPVTQGSYNMQQQNTSGGPQ